MVGARGAYYLDYPSYEKFNNGKAPRKPYGPSPFLTRDIKDTNGGAVSRVELTRFRVYLRTPYILKRAARPAEILRAGWTTALASRDTSLFFFSSPVRVANSLPMGRGRSLRLSGLSRALKFQRDSVVGRGKFERPLTSRGASERASAL